MIDIREAYDFLTELFESALGGLELTAIQDGRPHIHIDHARWDYQLLTDHLPLMARYNEAVGNIYYSVSTKTADPIPPGKRGGERIAREIPALWADCDGDKDGHYATLTTMPTPPSLIIDSGGGLQALWLLEAPVQADGSLKGILKGVQQAIGSDAVHNLDRLMRLPGFWNWKYDPPRLAQVIDGDWDRRYPLSAFEDYRVHDITQVERPRLTRPGDRNEGYLDAAAIAALIPGSQHHPRKRSWQWSAPCPAHDDQHPSLNFMDGDYATLFNCFAGCTVEAICAAVGVEVRQLFREERVNVSDLNELRLA